MKNLALLVVLVTIVILTLAGCSTDAVTNASTSGDSSRQISPKKTMRAFLTEEELANYLRKLAEEQATRRRDLAPSPQSVVKSSEPADKSNNVIVAREAVSDPDGESITNVQHAGVDEGGIVNLLNP